MKALLLTLLLAGSCFAPDISSRPFLCGSGDPPCPAGYTCGSDGVCSNLPNDSDGAIAVDAAAATADARSCASGIFQSCKNDDVAYYCNATGDGLVERPCPVGCSELFACLTLEASNLPNACDPPTSMPPMASITSDARWDTDNCVILGGQIVVQGPGLPDRCVVRYSDFAITSTGNFGIKGSRALVIIALGRMRLSGTLDVSAKGTVGGAGASAERLLGRGGSAGNNTSEGGGGGGHAGSGGSGGASDNGDIVYPGGVSIGNAALSPLTAGGFGGAGGFPCGDLIPCPSTRVAGGGGGGVVQLIACNELTIDATAIINAGGGGGPGGHGATGALLPGGGDGAGAGGGILIEAPVINVPGGATVTANGGGGGGGAAILAMDGKAGANGLLTTQPAEGGEGAIGSAGDGGRGGTSEDPDDGKEGSSGGGGGGAPGRIRLNTRPDRPPNVGDGAIISPEPSNGAIGRK